MDESAFQIPQSYVYSAKLTIRKCFFMLLRPLTAHAYKFEKPFSLSYARNAKMADSRGNKSNVTKAITKYLKMLIHGKATDW